MARIEGYLGQTEKDARALPPQGKRQPKTRTKTETESESESEAEAEADCGCGESLAVAPSYTGQWEAASSRIPHSFRILAGHPPVPGRHMGTLCTIASVHVHVSRWMCPGRWISCSRDQMET